MVLSYRRDGSPPSGIPKRKRYLTPTNPLSIVGLLLTLASLLGTFFYLHLSQWLRDVLALRQKTELNILQGKSSQQRAIVECRVELRRLASWHTYVVNLLVIAFVIFILVLGLDMIKSASSDPLYGEVRLAMFVFLGLFITLSIALMWLGQWNARNIKNQLK